MNIIYKEYSLNGVLEARKSTTRIILHHRAGNGDVESIDSLHKNNGWTCIGYHYYVRKDGTIYTGRPDHTIGAHALNNNFDSIGICAEGNFEIERMPEVQKQSIIELISELKDKYGNLKILRHKDVNNTACPGKNYPFEEIVNSFTVPCETVNKSNEELADEVIKGLWGNGSERKQRLTEAGYDYNSIQDIVNQKLLGTPIKSNSKSIDELAKEVIRGDWGNGSERKQRLTEAGYDYNSIQKRVNEILL